MIILPLTLEKILAKGYIPFILTNEKNLPHLDLHPWGIDVTVMTLGDPDAQGLIHYFPIMNGIAYNETMGMPRWVMLDCGMLPSAYVGFAAPSEKLPEEVMTKIERVDKGIAKELASYKGLVPVAEFCALPSVEHGRWEAYSLFSLIENNGLAVAAKALGLRVYDNKQQRVRKQRGVAQYDNTSLRIHTKFGPLQLIEACLTPAEHTKGEMTFIYEVDLEKSNVLEQAMETKYSEITEQQARESATILLDPNDRDAKQKIQEEIKNRKAIYHIIAPGNFYDQGKLLVPLKRTE